MRLAIVGLLAGTIATVYDNEHWFAYVLFLAVGYAFGMLSADGDP